MSRTDVHRPWNVQIADPTNRHLLYRFATWPDRMELIPWRNIGCGCRMCTGYYGRKLARSRERVAWRSRRQVILAAVDRDEVDVPPLARPTW